MVSYAAAPSGEDGNLLPGSLPGGIRLRYREQDPLVPGSLDPAGLQWMRPAGGMTVQLYSRAPRQSGKNSVVASGSGYTRGGQVPASAQVTHVNQPPGAIPGCNCPYCQPVPPTFAAGGIVPSPPASQPPSYVPPARTRPRVPGMARGMDGFDGAPLVAGTALGYRWWTLHAPQLHRNPSDAGTEWEPGLLRGQKDFWQPGVNRARCLAPSGLLHGHDQVPHEDCACGFWSYWEIQPHDLGMTQALPVLGVVRASGQVIMGPRGFRAQKAEIIALHLPFRIEPDLPPQEPARQPDYVRRALPGSSYTAAHRRFTGRVISYGTSYVPAPFRDVLPPREPAPPTEEEIQAAKDKAEAWMAVIADRLAVTYPGAEVCAGLDLMKAKYPVKSEYEPPEPEVMIIRCPYCDTPCASEAIHAHVVNNHYF